MNCFLSRHHSGHAPLLPLYPMPTIADCTVDQGKKPLSFPLTYQHPQQRASSYYGPATPSACASISSRRAVPYTEPFPPTVRLEDSLLRATYQKASAISRQYPGNIPTISRQYPGNIPASYGARVGDPVLDMIGVGFPDLVPGKAVVLEPEVVGPEAR